MWKLWLGLALAVAQLGCDGTPLASFAVPLEDAAGAGSSGDSGASGRGGNGAAAGTGGSGGSGSGGAGVLPDGGPPSFDAGTGGHSDSTGNDIADSGLSDADVGSMDGDSSRDSDAGTVLDGAPDWGRADSATPEAGKDAAIDKPTTIDAAGPQDANDGGLPPTCDYWIEPVPEATAPYPLCGAVTNLPSGNYQFSSLRLRQPFSPPRPIDPFVSGTMTVRNGAEVAYYYGRRWFTAQGEEIIFDGDGGAAIYFTTGVQEISVTTVDMSGKRGCLPQPCTWTVTR